MKTLKCACFGISFILVLWSVASAQGNGLTAAFSAANEFYRQGNYTQAVAAYERLRADGASGGGLYYNLANSYVKAGLVGKALVNYERARVSIPADSDVRANYAFAQNEAGVSPFYRGEPFLWRWIDRFFDGISLNGMTVLLTVIWVVIAALAVCRLFFKGFRRILGGARVFTAFCAVFCALGLVHKVVWVERGAVVVEKEAKVRFEPIQTATEYFTLSEGSPVLVLERNSGWYKIQRSDGKAGWVPQVTMEMINE